MTYALVRNNTVQRIAATPPEVFVRPSGDGVSGYNLRPDLWEEDGWLPVADVGPAPADDEIGEPVLTFTGKTVERTYPDIVPNPFVVEQREKEAVVAADLAAVDAIIAIDVSASVKTEGPAFAQLQAAVTDLADMVKRLLNASPNAPKKGGKGDVLADPGPAVIAGP